MRVLRFGAFALDVSRRALRHGDKELALRPQAFDILTHLAEHAGRVVSKDELIAAVWEAKPASDDSLVQCITDIRQTLGEEARSVIRTVPRRGYMFTADVTVLEAMPQPSPVAIRPGLDTQAGSSAQQSYATPGSEGRSDAAVGPQLWQRTLVAAGLLITVLVAGGWLIWQWTRPEPPAVLTMMAVPSLAVLPFEALGSEPTEVSAASALFDDVTTEISRQLHARMISLKPAAAYQGDAADLKAIGRQLDARYLLLGSLRREGNDTHANVRLIEAETGRQLWAEPFQSASGMRNHAVMRIAGMLAARLITIESQRPLPARPQAAHYAILAVAMQGNEQDAAANKEALALFEKALDLDRDWVPALLGYSLAQISHVHNDWAPANEHDSRLRKAEEAVERAIKLAPRNFLAYYRRAQLLRMRGDIDGAIAATGHALAMNPNFASLHATLGRNKIDMGLAHEAIAHIEEAIRLSPDHPYFFIWCFWAGQAAVHIGDYDAAMRWLQKARQASRAFPHSVPWLAVAYAGLGREEEGRALIKERISGGNRITISAWNKRLPPRTGILAEQRSRIVAMLRRLGVPEGKVQSGAAQ